MTAAHFEDHPTDPDKVILRKPPRIDQGPDYERGFVDGMQHQMQSSVDKAVNRMAQPEQKPVAFYVYKPTLPRGHLGNVSDGDLPWVYDQDPSSGYSARMLVYTTPPQRTWVGLTDEEIDAIYTGVRAVHHDVDSDVLCRAIEAKLKEKNT